MKKRILSLFLAVVMLALAIPAMALTAFAADEAADAKASVSTTFSLDSNLPVYKNEDGSPITGNFDFKGGWSFGSLALNTVNPASVDAISLGTTLTPYSGAYKLSSASSGTLYYSNKGNGWNESSASSKLGGGIIFLNGNQILMAPGVAMNVKGENGGYPRSIGSYGAAATIRYTAQYTGDVTVSIKGDWLYEYTQGYAHIFVLKNGTKIGDIVQGADAVDATITTTLTAGQNLDFVAVMDPTYKVENNDDGKGAFRIEAANRTFIVDSLKVEYSNLDSEVVAGSKWNYKSAASTTVNYAYNSEELRFLQWYDASGNPINAGGQLSSGCYAMLNPEMVTAAGIDLENDTYASAYEKYLDLLMKAHVLTVADSNWQIGDLDYSASSAAKFHAIQYPFLFIGKNLGLVSSSGTVDTPNDSNNNDRNLGKAGQGALYVTDATYKVLRDELKSDFAAYASDSALAGSVKIDYNSSMNSVSVATNAVRGARNAFALMGAPYTGVSAGGYTWGELAYRYTAPYTGTVTFVIDGFEARFGGGAETWNIAVNGVRMQAEPTQFSWNNADQLNAYKNAVKALSFTVKAGDTIDFLYAETNVSNGFDNCFFPTISASMTYDPMNHEIEGQMSILADYSLSVLAKPLNEGGVVSAIVDGKVVEGVAQENGSYKMEIAEGIKLTDLTSITVSYQLFEASNGHELTTAAKSISAVELLEAYASSSNDKVATLAKDIHYLAIAANYIQSGMTTTPLTKAQETHIQRNISALTALPTDIAYTGEEGAYKIVGANANMGDRLSLIFLIDATADADIWALKGNGYKLYAYNEGETLTAEATEFAGVTVGGKEYIGVIVDIPVAAYGETMNFVLMDAEGNAASSVLSYGVNTWCARAHAQAGYSSMKNVVRAIYNLGISAAAYQASL